MAAIGDLVAALVVPIISTLAVSGCKRTEEARDAGPSASAKRLDAGPAASAEVPNIAPGLAFREDANDPCEEKAWPTCTARAMILRQSRRQEDKVRAHQRLSRACDAGYLSACSEVGRNLAEGVGVAKDVDAGLALMRKTCNSSLASCNNLGVAYYLGWTGKPDFPEAARLYLRGCSAGEVAGCGNWATMVLDGEIEGDRARALAQLEAACTPSFPIACHALGVFHQLKSATPDVTKARGYYRLACDAANADACNNLGTIYEGGNGVPRDFAAAAKLYAFSCEFGVGTSCRRLSILFANGAGVPRDMAKARELLAAACDSGERRACSELGR
jgi:TPR repeat protein